MRTYPMMLACCWGLTACATMPTSDKDTDAGDTDTVRDTDDTVVDRDTGEGRSTWSFHVDGETILVEVSTEGPLRDVTLTTSHTLRDGASDSRRVVERDGKPRMRSGHLLFDALFALAVQETAANAVSTITDGAFNGGQGVACDCFETGAEWHYVWTRDTAYAADLGLVYLDPGRVMRSLDFKLSAPKAGGPLRIVQDTGSGGSWPVSTDRVVWALGARAVLPFLEGATKTGFEARALEAMATTLEEDRLQAFDADDGLYRGEQSFLDWREQSYARWTATDTVHLATSKALSTNLAHLVLLRTAAGLAADAGDARAATWSLWADDLQAAIHATFWLPDDGLFAAMTATELDGGVLRKADLLGEALAVLEGVATPEQARTVLSSYPFAPFGPPVIWPQQPDTPIYHNRGIWPFVTAYGVIAARRAGHDAAFDAGVDSLVRGAAWNLSNMENFELVTQRNWVDDGPLSGPVVNSERQLWSVAGYLGMVLRGVLGIEPDADGVTVAPFITAGLRDGWLAGTDTLQVLDVPLPGGTLDVTVDLPPVGTLTTGAYAVTAVTLDGVTVPDGRLTRAQVASGAALSVTLSATGAAAGQSLRVVSDPAQMFAPHEPTNLSVVEGNASWLLTWDAVPESGVVYRVRMDGVEVSEDLTEPQWSDPLVFGRAPCFSVVAAYPGTDRVSHPSRVMCGWRPAEDRVRTYDAHHLIQTAGDGVWDTLHGRAHHRDWGGVDDVLTVFGLQPNHTGFHRLQLAYGNGAGPVNTGITAANKTVVVTEEGAGTVVAEGRFVMPHRTSWADWGDSSTVGVWLDAGRTYQVQISDGPNMSYLDHFVPYTGGLGGGATPFHNVNIAALKVLAMDGDTEEAPPPPVVFDGVDDIDAFAAGQVLTGAALGAPLDAWNAVGLDWDAQHLYVSVVSSAFEEDFAPVMIYLQAGVGDLGPAVPGVGSPYTRGSVTAPAGLPFTPTHQITLRASNTLGPDGGPYNGVWAYDGVNYALRQRLAWDSSAWIAADRHTLSARIPRALLGTHDTVRIAAHVLWGVAGQEWKGLVPAGHTPWQADGGSYLELDLTAVDHSLPD